MAAITICDPCQVADHEHCLKDIRKPPADLPEGEEWYGGLFCVCPCRQGFLNVPAMHSTGEAFEYMRQHR